LEIQNEQGEHDLQIGVLHCACCILVT